MRAKRGGRDDGAKQRRASRARAGRGGAGRAAGAAGKLTRRLRVAMERGPGGRSEHMGVAPRQSAPTRALRPAARCSGGSTRIYAPPPKRAITPARKGEKGEAERGPGPRGPGLGGHALRARPPRGGRPARRPSAAGRARIPRPQPRQHAARGTAFGLRARAWLGPGLGLARARRPRQGARGRLHCAGRSGLGRPQPPRRSQKPQKSRTCAAGGACRRRAQTCARRGLGGPIRDRAAGGAERPRGRRRVSRGEQGGRGGARPMGEGRRA